MANEAEQAIYTRLANAPTFHPVTADLFVNDWGLDAGDVVTVRSGETDYSVPIYNMSLDWRGSAMAQIQSTGNKERKPLSALKRKQFAGGRSNYMAEKAVEHYDTQFIQDKMNIGMIASAMGVVLDENGNPMINEETGEYVWDDENGAEIYSRMILEHNRAELVSAINDGTGTQISGAKIDLSAQGKVLIQAINNRPGSQSSVVIQADKIDLTGLVTASQLDTRLANIDTLFTTTGYAGSIGAETVNAGIVYAGSYGIDEDTFTMKTITIGTSSIAVLGATNSISVDAIASVAEDANPPAGKIGFTYTMLGGSTGSVNFNIADTAKYKADVGMKTLASDGASFDPSDYNDWDCPVLGTLSYGGYYLVKATPNAGSPMYVKFAVPSDRYNAGWSAAEGKVDWPETNTTASFTVKAPSSTVGNQTSKTFVLDQTGSTVYAYMGGTTVATLPVSGGGSSYADGWNGLVEAADTSSYVQYSGASSVSSSLSKSNGTIDGYIWLKDYSGTWQRRRHLTVSYPNDSYNKSVTLTYRGAVDGVYTYTTSTYVSGLSTGSRYTVHFNA